jgi:hypothetical protein
VRESGLAKLARGAFRLPLAQVSRQGLRTVVWGQVRPRAGRQPYRLQQRGGGSWRWVGATSYTGVRGQFTRAVRAGKGAQFRIWSPRDQQYSPALRIR